MSKYDLLFKERQFLDIQFDSMANILSNDLSERFVQTGDFAAAAYDDTDVYTANQDKDLLMCPLAMHDIGEGNYDWFTELGITSVNATNYTSEANDRYINFDINLDVLLTEFSGGATLTATSLFVFTIGLYDVTNSEVLACKDIIYPKRATYTDNPASAVSYESYADLTNEHINVNYSTCVMMPKDTVYNVFVKSPMEFSVTGTISVSTTKHEIA